MLLLFDRSSRRAAPTPAGLQLLRNGERLLSEIDAIANRVKRVATGWEPQLTISVDGVMSPHTLLELAVQRAGVDVSTELAGVARGVPSDRRCVGLVDAAKVVAEHGRVARGNPVDQP